MTEGPDRRFSDGATAGPVSWGRRSWRVVRWLLLGLALAAILLYGAAYAYAGDRLPRNTTIEGVDVGGLFPEQAEEVLARTLADRAPATVRVSAADREVAIDPASVGLRVDVAASVAQVAVGRSPNPADLWQVVSGGRAHEAVVEADDRRLTERLDALAERVDRAPREGAVRFEADGPVPTYPRPGRALDVEAAQDAVLDAFPTQVGPVTLAIDRVSPQLTADDVDRAVEQFAEPALEGPVTLTAAGESAALTPERYAPTLSMRAAGGRLVPSADPAALAGRVEAVLPGASLEPRDATVALVDGRPRVVPGRSGRTVDEDRLAAAFVRTVAAEGDDRILRVPTTAVDEPVVTTQEVRSWGVREVVAEFTTYYPHADYRNINIGRAAELLDGTVLAPGELFSFNETVGERTAANGFTRGFVISNGIFAEDYGGGVSQMATTTFNAAFFAGLEDVEHKPHSFYIDRYPVGREATVAWPTIDLKFRNDTGHGVLIETRLSPSTYSSSGAVTVRLWSSKVWDIEALTGARYNFTSPATRVLTGDDCYPNTGYEGFDVDVTRVFRRAGSSAVHHREVMHTTYTPSDTVICR